MQKSIVQLIARSRLVTTGVAVAVYNFCVNKTTKRQNIWFPRDLQPVSRHATVNTGPTFMSRLCSYIDEFPLNGYQTE